jgi:hypothetical protein
VFYALLLEVSREQQKCHFLNSRNAMKERNKLVAVRQSGASKIKRGKSTKRFMMIRIMSATSRIVALMRIYFAALDDADLSDKSPTLL